SMSRGPDPPQASEGLVPLVEISRKPAAALCSAALRFGAMLDLGGRRGPLSFPRPGPGLFALTWLRRPLWTVRKQPTRLPLRDATQSAVGGPEPAKGIACAPVEAYRLRRQAKLVAPRGPDRLVLGRGRRPALCRAPSVPVAQARDTSLSLHD